MLVSGGLVAFGFDFDRFWELEISMIRCPLCFANERALRFCVLISDGRAQWFGHSNSVTHPSSFLGSHTHAHTGRPPELCRAPPACSGSPSLG